MVKLGFLANLLNPYLNHPYQHIFSPTKRSRALVEMDHRRRFFNSSNLFLRLPCKSLCFGGLLIFIFSTLLFFIDCCIGFDWKSFSGVEVYKENLVSNKSIYVTFNIFNKEMAYWDWRFLTEILLCKMYPRKMFSSHLNLEILRLTVSKTSVMNVTLIFTSLSIQVYKFLVPLSCRMKLQVSLFKNWINIFWKLKNTFLHIYLFVSFWWKKIIFSSNIFTFRNQNRIFLTCFFLFLNL